MILSVSGCVCFPSMGRSGWLLRRCPEGVSLCHWHMPLSGSPGYPGLKHGGHGSPRVNCGFVVKCRSVTATEDGSAILSHTRRPLYCFLVSLKNLEAQHQAAIKKLQEDLQSERCQYLQDLELKSREKEKAKELEVGPNVTP